MWLAKVVAIFTHRSSLLHRISPIRLFYLKTKIRYIFSFHSSFGVLIFTFDMHVWMTYFFCMIKNSRDNVDVLLKEKNQTNVVQGIIPHYLLVWGKQLKNISFAVISLFILRENSLSEGEIFDNKNFYNIINQSKFLFTTLTRLHCVKH